jgi:hypothetical protein
VIVATAKGHADKRNGHTQIQALMRDFNDDFLEVG